MHLMYFMYEALLARSAIIRYNRDAVYDVPVLLPDCAFRCCCSCSDVRGSFVFYVRKPLLQRLHMAPML